VPCLTRDMFASVMGDVACTRREGSEPSVLGVAVVGKGASTSSSTTTGDGGNGASGTLSLVVCTESGMEVFIL